MRRREKLLFKFAAENFSGGQGLENVPVSELDSLLVLVAVNVSKKHFALLDDACPCGFRIDTNAARVGDLDPKAFTAFVLLVQRRGAELYEVAFVDFRQLGRIGDEGDFGMLFILRNGILQGGLTAAAGSLLGRGNTQNWAPSKWTSWPTGTWKVASTVSKTVSSSAWRQWTARSRGWTNPAGSPRRR